MLGEENQRNQIQIRRKYFVLCKENQRNQILINDNLTKERKSQKNKRVIEVLYKVKICRKLYFVLRKEHQI